MGHLIPDGTQKSPVNTEDSEYRYRDSNPPSEE